LGQIVDSKYASTGQSNNYMIAKTILLIDCDKQDVTSFERALEKINLPITLYIAFSIKEGVEILNERKIVPDIIMMDPNMPGQDGISFLEDLRKDTMFDATKVFVMTTSNEREDRRRVEALGISGYILKPMNFTENTKRSSYMDYFMHFQIMKILVSRNEV
jgi:CheY-like chemotaxis protein